MRILLKRMFCWLGFICAPDMIPDGDKWLYAECRWCGKRKHYGDKP